MAPFVALLTTATLAALARARLAAPSTNESVAKHDSVLPVASCSQRLFELLGNPAYDGYDECVNGKLNSSKSVWVGATAGAYAQCWCAWNMSAFVSAQGCENHGNWNWLTQVQCGVNCSDGAALQCRKSCPMYCFDGGPNLLGCACRNECMKLVGCMARSKDLTFNEDVNSSEAPVQCSPQTLRQSKEMKTFDDCASANVTYGNMWRSLSQTYRCLCSGHLQQELRSQNCCESSSDSSSRSFCEANCSVDCSTPEALQCSEQCSSMCEGTKASQECNEQCLQSTGHCNQYKVCPVATPKFSYVCDDGEAPGLNGCCQGVFDNDRCPFLCEAQWKKSDIWSGTSRCECGACPSSVEESRKLMNETLLAAYERDATKQLIILLMTRGLRELTPEMRKLFAMQMEAVQSVITRYDGKGLLNWKLVHSLRVVSSFYFQKLSQAADAEAESLKSHGTGSGMIWFALISCLCVISTIIIGCIISKSLALKQSRTQAIVTAPTDTLVVGRPISSKDHPPEDAIQGVLVAAAAASR